MRTYVGFPLALLSFLIVLSAWAVSSPPGSSPDDDFHLASAYCGQGTRQGLCENPSTGQGKLIPSGVIGLQNCYYKFRVSANCQISELQVKEGSKESTERLNTGGLYPRLFYLFSSVFASSSVANSALAMRFLNISLILSLFGLTYYASSRKYRKMLPMTWCVSSLPFGLFIFSSNNPSSWAVSGLSCYAFLLANILDESEPRRKEKILPVLLIGMFAALGSRNDSSIFLFLFTVVVCLYSLPYFKVQFSRYCATSFLLLTVSIAAYMTITNPTRIVQGGFVSKDLPYKGIDLLNSNIQAIPLLLFGSFGFSSWTIPHFGNLGWFNTPVPPITTFLVFGVFVFLCSRKISIWPTQTKIAVGILWLLFISCPLYMHQMDHTFIGQYIQPRYFFAFILLIVGFSILSFQAVRADLSNFSSISIWIALTLGHSFCLHLFIRRYTSGYGGFGVNLNSGVLWWEYSVFSPMTTWISGSVFFGIFSAFATNQMVSSTEPVSPSHS